MMGRTWMLILWCRLSKGVVLDSSDHRDCDPFVGRNLIPTETNHDEFVGIRFRPTKLDMHKLRDFFTSFAKTILSGNVI